MEGKGHYSALEIAEWFLFYNRIVMEEADADFISNLKLQKLLYYAQGCYLALTGEKLFPERILAWEHGPVVNEVYQEYKIYGSRGIDYEDEFNVCIDKDTESILKEVYDIFGKYSAWGLRNMTHRESPWLETPRNYEISCDSIRDYFLENYVEA